MDDASGQRSPKRKPLSFMNDEKPTSEKMRTELVSPTERTLEQVADRLKRKTETFHKESVAALKSRQKSSSACNNKSGKVKGLKIFKKRTQKKKIKSKRRAKDIFN